MKINVQIEQLSLHGISVAPHEHPQLQGAVESELARLMSAGGLNQELAAGAAVPSVNASTMQLTSPAGPVRLGQGIARSVYGGLGQ